MTIIPHNTDSVDVEMGFAEPTIEELEPEGNDPITQLAEEILLLGFLGGLRRIKDECNSLKTEYDVLMGNIDQEELAAAMECIDESFVKSQEDIDTAVELINKYMESNGG